MTVRYVGAGGNDSNSGLTWALRKLTLNGVEDTPIVAGDTVYVGAGTYRETLTVDVSGTFGNVITYIADKTGINTDGIGGIVRVTGSDNDTSNARANIISAATGKNFRTFRGFHFDMGSGAQIVATSVNNWIIEDCDFYNGAGSSSILFQNVSLSNITIRRCFFSGEQNQYLIHFSHTVVVNDINALVENCIFTHGGRSVASTRVGGITVKNCLFHGVEYGVRVITALDTGQTITVNNCILDSVSLTAFIATAVGEIVENYNSIYGAQTPRSNTNTGANSNTYPGHLRIPSLLSGFILPFQRDFAPWSQLKQIAGTSESTDDFFGRTRPTTSALKSWGALQYDPISLETGTFHGGAKALKLETAGRLQFLVPVTNTSTTFSVYVYRETDYAGTNPQMVIKQNGQSDQTVTDVGASGGWNQLTTTFSPAASPPWAVIELVSNNTAVAGNYDTFFDDLDVS